MSHKSFFVNEDFLEESYDDKDLVDTEQEVKSLDQKIEFFLNSSGGPRFLAYLGAFGVGKSYALKLLQKRRTDLNFIVFESWRYPDRNQLWDAFCILAASKITGKSESEISAVIDGYPVAWISKVLSSGRRKIVAFSLAILFWGSVSFFLWEVPNIFFKLFKISPDSTGIIFFESLLKYGLSGLTLMLVTFGIETILPNKEKPLSRVFELEKILQNSLGVANSNIVFVLEDTDRTTDGSVFLETLRIFFQKYKFSNVKITIIAPQTLKAFNYIQDGRNLGLHDNIKIYDQVLYYDNSFNAKKIILFIKKITKKTKKAKILADLFSQLALDYPDDLSLRMIKFVIRQSISFVNTQGKNLDINVVVYLILSKYIISNIDSFDTTKRFVSEVLRQNSIDNFMLCRHWIIMGEKKSDNVKSRFSLVFLDQISKLEINLVPEKDSYSVQVKLPAIYKQLI